MILQLNKFTLNDSPIEQVRLIVPITDDPTLLCLPIRTWFLGITSCAVLSFTNQFFSYSQNTYIISYIPNCSTSNSEAYGSISTKNIHSHSKNKKVLFVESKSLQLREHVLIKVFRIGILRRIVRGK